jgi:hypothetical protein
VRRGQRTTSLLCVPLYLRVTLWPDIIANMQRLHFYFLIFALLITLHSLAQDDRKDADLRNNNVGLNVQLPAGEFSETHNFGVGLTYSRGDYRTMRIKKVGLSKIKFTYQAGVAWYNGRREVRYDYSYDYPSFILIHLYGGLRYRPSSSVELKLLSGPAMGIYDKQSLFNIGADLVGGYFINDNFSINPGIGIQVEGGTAAKVVAKIGAQFKF